MDPLSISNIWSSSSTTSEDVHPHKGIHDELAMVKGRSQTTFTDFWPFLTPLPPWLTALLNKICHIYLVTLTFDEPPLPPWL